MSEFKWHMMAEEMPEKGKKDYLVMGLKGGLYLAPRFEGYGERGDDVWFRDTRGNHHYPDKVLAWAEIPKLEDMDAQESENAMLREQTELLVTLLSNDWDIDASWDGLRKFWHIGLTESGCLMRDRACKAEAENEKLRELFYEAWDWMQRARYDGSIRADEMDEIGVKAIKLGFPVYELGIEVKE